MTAPSTPKDGPPPTYPGGGSKNISNEPLYGFVPRRVTAKQVKGVLVREDTRDATDKKLTKVQDGDVNPFNKKPYSAQHKKILQAIKKLPVYAQMAEFYEVVSIPSSI
jgi:pre-mRNA-splicing factor ATP-dependent RNA helicase DHX15/PRP43